MNPFGVGHSGDDFAERTARCGCCGLPFKYQTLRTQPEARHWCPDCEEHHPQDGEPIEREVDRLRAHDQVLRQRAADASAAATRYETQMLGLREQVAAALQTRDDWRALLEDVRSAHIEEEAGRCSCGQAFPCVTLDVLNGDPGRAQHVADVANQRQRRWLDTEGGDDP